MGRKGDAGKGRGGQKKDQGFRDCTSRVLTARHFDRGWSSPWLAPEVTARRPKVRKRVTYRREVAP